MKDRKIISPFKDENEFPHIVTSTSERIKLIKAIPFRNFETATLAPGHPRYEAHGPDVNKRLVTPQGGSDLTVSTMNAAANNNKVDVEIPIHSVPGASCISVSLYPYMAPELAQFQGERLGDPIADSYHIQLKGSRVAVVLADGCNWGKKPMTASNNAGRAFLDCVVRHEHLCTNTHATGFVLLRAMAHAHRAVTHGEDGEEKLDYWDCGTTTLSGGVVFPLKKGKDGKERDKQKKDKKFKDKDETVNNLDGDVHNTTDDDEDRKKYGFVCLGVGDCKAYRYSSRTTRFTDITIGNRKKPSDPRDPGGRLGPYLDEGKPDLANLEMYYAEIEEGDIISVCSDGVWDNYDPEMLGIEPKELCLEQDKWEDVPFKTAVQEKDHFLGQLMREQVLEEKYQELKEGEGHAINLTPQDIAFKLVRHCVVTTQICRDFMEQNPNLKQPSDYKKYPGKIDHSTCISFKVGGTSAKEMSNFGREEYNVISVGEHTAGTKTDSSLPPETEDNLVEKH